MANFQKKSEIFFPLRTWKLRYKRDISAAVTTPVTAHDRYNELGSPRFQGK